MAVIPQIHIKNDHHKWDRVIKLCFCRQKNLPANRNPDKMPYTKSNCRSSQAKNYLPEA
jgi:hypothetical protein